MHIGSNKQDHSVTTSSRRRPVAASVLAKPFTKPIHINWILKAPFYVGASMQDLKMQYSISSDLDRSEVHFKISGYWNVESMKDFLGDLQTKLAPLKKRRQPFKVLCDFHDFVPQNQEAAGIIRKYMLSDKDAGLSQVAIVSPSPLVKLQYQRITQGIDVEYFKSKVDAMRWLRASS